MKKILITFCAVAALAACHPKHKTYPDNASKALIEELEHKVGNTVLFAYDCSSVSSESKVTLDKQVEFMKRNPDLKFFIEGYCDERGTVEYNIALGERRAHSAHSYLADKGVDKSRFTVVSYGKEHPAVDGHSEEAWRYNRRAVTSIR